MTPPLRLGSLFLVCALGACGGKASSLPGGDVSQGGEGNSSGATSTAGTGNAASGGKSNAGGSSGTAGASACTRYDDEAGLLVDVSLENQTGQTIYLGQPEANCSEAPLFQVADAGGSALEALGYCRASCEQVRNQGGFGCPSICAFPNAIALGPGELHTTTWDGLFGVDTTLPNQCSSWNAGGESLSCRQAKRIQPGTFTFSARAGNAMDCAQVMPTGCGMCSPDPDGGCSTPGATVGGKLFHAIAAIELDESFGVYPTSKSGGDADAPAGPSMRPVVRLIFKP